MINAQAGVARVHCSLDPPGAVIAQQDSNARPLRFLDPRAVATIFSFVVAAAAFVISYNSLTALGEEANIAPPWLYPVVVDGTIGVGTSATFALWSARWRTRVYVWTVLGLAIAVSVYGNALHAGDTSGQIELGERAAMVLSAVPALALAASLHLLVILMREDGRMAGHAERTPRARPIPGTSLEPSADAGAEPKTPVRLAGPTPSIERDGDEPPFAPEVRVDRVAARRSVSAADEPRRRVAVAHPVRSGLRNDHAVALIEKWSRAGEDVTSTRLAHELGCTPSAVRKMPAWRAYKS